jgi:CRP-like cAMP-binding protein
MTGIMWFDAFVFGIISAISLPLGVLIAFIWTPKPKILASLMAIGAGALLAALTIDLVATTLGKGHYYPLAIGMISGGIFFVLLNKIVENKGGFLRKTATTLSHIHNKNKYRQKLFFKQLSKVNFFHNLAPSKAHLITPYLNRYLYRQGKIIVHDGDPGDNFYIIEKGSAIIMDDRNNTITGMLKENDTYGIIEMLNGLSHTYTVIVREDMHVWVINKESLDKIISLHPQLAKDIRELLTQKIHLLDKTDGIDNSEAESWYKQALEHIDEKKSQITESDVHEEVNEHGNVSLAIWLGMLLDGIPESIVIGSSLIINNKVSFSLIAGLFLSNLPEALSSSVGMKKQKLSRMKIMALWLSITIIAGVCSLGGNVFFSSVSDTTFAIVDGMAAGAMLTMIAETMLPEAFHIGGSVTGLSVLGGFLATLLFKVIGG